MLGPRLSEIDYALVWSKSFLSTMALFQLLAFIVGPFSPEWSGFLFMVSLVCMAVAAHLNSVAWETLAVGMRSIGKKAP